MNIAEWINHFPRFHVVNTVVEVLREEQQGLGGEALAQQQLVTLLPDICLALPSCSLSCAHLLHSLPNNSHVWSKLEEALANKKLLHPEIIVALYLKHPPALERELMRVLGLYVGAGSQGVWWDEETLSIAYFRLHGCVPYANSKTKERQGWRDQSKKSVERREGQSCSRDETDKDNTWKASPAFEVAVHSEELFHRCISFLGSVLVNTNFSFPAVVASRDFLAQVSTVMKDELYQAFPSDLTHLAYLLSLPLATKQEQDDLKDPPLLQVIENGLREELAQGGKARERVCVMLSLFSFWLPVLRESGFLESYLADGVCDVFCGGDGCR